ncbi:hypothetical protein VitviT2T_024149 [Vitis vinifera]|uniref:Uncharacterized protein n=1 Tax=Vitis vinifera TaxID=29760 RepID=A0ABY9DGU8_VITVI|nr:hypothetical protein VitviT2T_024149 [Vitis vinifera]
MNENFEMLCWGLCRESCNQGVFMLQELEKQELKEVRFTIDVNLMGTFHFIKAPLSRMRHWKEAWTNVDRHYIIVGQSVGSTVYYNLKLRHPTLDMPIICYDLALLFQPMLMMGISIGVVFNVAVADWMVTILLIVLFLGTPTKAFIKGVETWKKETIMKRNKCNGTKEVEYKPLPSGLSNGTQNATRKFEELEVSIKMFKLDGTWASCSRLGCFPYIADCKGFLIPDLIWIVQEGSQSTK